MCKMCQYEGQCNSCPICHIRLPCSMKFRHTVCNNCVNNPKNIPYTANNTRLIYYNDYGSLCYRHEYSNSLTYVKKEKEKYCYIKGCPVYVQKGPKNQVYYQAI